MVENRPLTRLFAHLIMIAGVLLVMFPVYVMLVTASHELAQIAQAPLPLLPGKAFFTNLHSVLTGAVDKTPLWRLLVNSLIMALGIAVLKIAVSLPAAYAVVYYRFPLRDGFFWLIFITLMLPVEVRIVPTFSVVATLHLVNSYTGLILPLIASATATFLFRQTFLSIPEEMFEAARIDGAGPLRFFRDILLPLSRTNIAAVFVILYTYGWNQYLWPMMVATDPALRTIVMSIKTLIGVADQVPRWNTIMIVSLIAMLPPVVVVLLMQKSFVRGLTEREK